MREVSRILMVGFEIYIYECFRGVRYTVEFENWKGF